LLLFLHCHFQPPFIRRVQATHAGHSRCQVHLIMHSGQLNVTGGSLHLFSKPEKNINKVKKRKKQKKRNYYYVLFSFLKCYSISVIYSYSYYVTRSYHINSYLYIYTSYGSKIVINTLVPVSIKLYIFNSIGIVAYIFLWSVNTYILI
jgi:hypothetical protein